MVGMEAPGDGRLFCTDIVQARLAVTPLSGLYRPSARRQRLDGYG